MNVPEPIELRRMVWELYRTESGEYKLLKTAICQMLFERYDLKWHEIAFAMNLKKQVDVDRLKKQHRELVKTNELYQSIYNQIK